MILSQNSKITTTKILYLVFIFCTVLLLTWHRVFNRWFVSVSSIFPLHLLRAKANQLCPQNKSNNGRSPYPLDKILLNLTFSPNLIYHHNGIAYDYYSILDLEQSNAGCQWKLWSLPNELNQTSSIDPIETSPLIISKLPFVDVIYVMTDPRLTERHANLKKAFNRQGISLESIDWRMEWNYTTCNSNASHSHVYQRLNLNEKPLNKNQRQRCALAMKHTDVWYEMVEKNIKLGLIIEDDAIFVPFFKEKFTRMIYAAINQEILRFNETNCIKAKEKLISDNERINQNPMIVIGTCFHFHSEYFQKNLLNPSPIFSTHKSNPSRCTHAYLLTLCSAQALVDQIQSRTNDFFPSDFLQNYLFSLSPTLQSFWMDPPLSYQGNQVIDLDKISSFQIQTYIQSDN